MMTDLSIIIPAYNEEQRLPDTLKKIDTYFYGEEPNKVNVEVDIEVIVVDDGSTDQTVQVANKLNLPYVTVASLPRNKGKFAALKHGLGMATKSWVLLYDADSATPINMLDKFSEHLADNVCLIGSRAMPDSEILQKQAPWRVMLGRTGNFVIRLFTGLPYRDTQCGFKLISLDLAKKITPELTVEGFAGDVELLYLCQANQAQIKEIGVIWQDVPISTVKPMDYPKTLLELLKIRNKYK